MTKDLKDSFIINSGVTFALLPVKCWDGKWAWMRLVGWADVQDGFFFNPYTIRRIYSADRRATK